MVSASVALACRACATDAMESALPGAPGIMDENQVMARPFSPTVVSSRPTIAAAVMRVNHFVVRDACGRRVRAATRPSPTRGVHQRRCASVTRTRASRIAPMARRICACVLIASRRAPNPTPVSTDGMSRRRAAVFASRRYAHSAMASPMRRRASMTPVDSFAGRPRTPGTSE